MKQTINRAEILAVTAVIRRFGGTSRKIGVAMDSEFVYAGLQRVAAKWELNRWVSSASPMLNVNLWIEAHFCSGSFSLVENP